MRQPDRGRPDRSARRSLVGWVVGFGCSVLADQIFFLSLAWAAVQLNVPGLVGLVLAAGSLPRLLVLLLGGALADAKSPKRIIIGTDSGRAVVMAGAAVILLLGSMNAWALAAVAVAIGTLDGFFLPAVAALPVRLASSEPIGRVAALRTVTQRVGMLAGGPVAGWLIYLYGPGAAFAGSSLLFTLSVISLAMVTLSPSPATEPAAPVAPWHRRQRRQRWRSRRVLARTWAETTSSFRMVRRDPVLAGLLLLIAGMNLGFSGPFTAGIPLLAAGKGWGAHGAGLLVGAFGIGAAVSGLGLLLLRRVPRAGLVQLAAMLSMGLAVAAPGVVTHLSLALAGAVVLGLSSGVFGTVAYGLLLDVTPTAEVGRVMALLSLILEGTAGVSFLATGAIASTLGAGATFLLGGLVIVLSTFLGALQPYLRVLRMQGSDAAARKGPRRKQGERVSTSG